MRMESYVAGYADTIRSINEQLSTATAEVERLRGALGKLAKQLRVVTDSPEYLAVWHLYWAHGGNYSGPRYKEELETAESMLEEAALKGE